jgi:hypothetical protein
MTIIGLRAQWLPLIFIALHESVPLLTEWQAPLIRTREEILPNGVKLS